MKNKLAKYRAEREKNDQKISDLQKRNAQLDELILEEENRWCMALDTPNNGENCPVGFVPRPQYIREMVRYGILPPDHDPKQPIDPWELDKKYWRSLWYEPKK